MHIDLKELLSSKKFIPILNERINLQNKKQGSFSVEIHWTSICNYNCIHCSYGKRRQNPVKLSEEVIENLLTDLNSLNTRSVYLSGGGEPTTVKNWHKYADFLLKNNIEVALITNGVNVNNENIKILRKFNYIAVSVYSTDAEEYKEITRSSFFDKQFLLPSIIKTENTETIVGARCVINNINFKNVLSTYEKAISSGFDYIIFIPAIDYENSGVGLKKKNSLWLLEFLNQNKDSFDFSKTNIDSCLNKQINHYQIKDYREDLVFQKDKCFAADLRTNAYINYDGEVYLCQPHIGKIEYSIGNLNIQRLSKIWNSDKHDHVINLLNNDFKNGKCKNCRSISFNIEGNKFLNGNYEVNNTIIKDPFI